MAGTVLDGKALAQEIEVDLTARPSPWMAAAYSIAHSALKNDAPEECQASFRPAYQRFLDVLGIDTLEAFEKRATLAEKLLSRTMAVTESIIEQSTTHGGGEAHIGGPRRLQPKGGPKPSRSPS